MADDSKRKQPSSQSSSNKRARYDAGDTDQPGGFAAELALFETIESERTSDKSQTDSQESQGEIVNVRVSPAGTGGSAKWCRPDPPQLDTAKEKFIFQQLEIDDYVGEYIIWVFKNL